MKKISLLLLSGLLFYGCSVNQPSNNSLSQENKESKKISDSSAITVSGRYWESGDYTIFPRLLCFDVDKNTGSLIPRAPTDSRIPWFCFRDQSKAKSAFSIDDNEIFNNPVKYPNLDCIIEGAATVKINNYELGPSGTESYDTADLQEVIEKSPYSKCK